MSESDMRHKVVKILKPIGGFAVENPCLPGTPDVNHWHGWIELKYRRSWPIKVATIIRLHRFTIKQKRFLRDRWNGNQDAYLLIQINGSEWLLFKGNMVEPISRDYDREQLCKNAFRYWKTTAKMEQELVPCLQQRNDF
jgi:hypothetical protein